MKFAFSGWTGTLVLAGLFSAMPLAPQSKLDAAEPVIPGTGQKVVQVGDDFEDPEWQYIPNNPKSSRDLDEQQRFPAGASLNKRWYEGIKRGHPDVVRRVPTPPGGLEGSTGSLLLQSLHTGIPGYNRNRMGQDDFIADVNYRLGGSIPVWQSPSAVVRVFLPPVDQWEHRNGPHFGFRLALDTTVIKSGRGGGAERETYWPGLFICFESQQGPEKDDYAYIRLRGNRNGGDYKSLQITQTGWWTMGMSVTPDGQVHYYAKPGIGDLTDDDHLASEFPYGYRAQRFKTFFFNVCSADNGRSWSTPWIVDDPSLYYIPNDRTAEKPQQPSR